MQHGEGDRNAAVAEAYSATRPALEQIEKLWAAIDILRRAVPKLQQRLDTLESAGSDSPLYDAWVVIANARDWHLPDRQAREWVEAAQRWRDVNGFGVSARAGRAEPPDRAIVVDRRNVAWQRVAGQWYAAGGDSGRDWAYVEGEWGPVRELWPPLGAALGDPPGQV